MTDKPAVPASPADPAIPTVEPAQPRAAHTVDGRPYSPGLEGVIAAETELGLVDGANGRLMYRGYRIGDLVAQGTYAAVANLLWTGNWDPRARMAAGRIPSAVMAALRALPRTAKPMDALRTAVSVWGATQALDWPPTEIRPARSPSSRRRPSPPSPASGRTSSRSTRIPSSTSSRASCTS